MEGCQVPNCGDGLVQRVIVDHGSGAVGTRDVNRDVEQWISNLVGQGEAHGIPTPSNKLGFLVTRDDADLALLWYVSDGSGGWLRDGYSACASALLSN
jgi:hypothetical protein